MNHEELYRNAIKAINNLFKDNSVSEDVTRKDLEDLKEEIEICIMALDADVSLDE